MRSSQLRKTVNRNRNRNRNKRKTWRNKRTKNARGGKLILITAGDQEYEQDDVTREIFNAYIWINGKRLPIFDGKMNEKGDGHGKLYRYYSDGKTFSMYEGPITDKKKQGHGKFKTYDSNGNEDSVYDGDWTDNKKQGHGKFKTYDSNGNEDSVYDGDWTDDKKDGYGVYQKRYTYSGQWKNDEKNGKGVESGPIWSGSQQIGTIQTDGNWVNNKAVYGVMSIIYKNGTKSVYVGELNGVNNRHGTGTYTFYDKDGHVRYTYDGDWTDNKKQGHGKFKTYDSNGNEDSVYDGDWTDDKKDGYGVYQKRYTYSGQWKNDEKNGKGVESGPIWSGSQQIGTIQTDGNWVNNKAVYGVMSIIYKNGTKSVYVGELNGVNNRHGTGTYTFYDKDGHVRYTYSGQWDNNKMVNPLETLRRRFTTPPPPMMGDRFRGSDDSSPSPFHHRMTPTPPPDKFKVKVD